MGSFPNTSDHAAAFTEVVLPWSTLTLYVEGRWEETLHHGQRHAASVM